MAANEQALLDEVLKNLDHRKESCWIPVTRDGSGARCDSKYSGLPLLRKDEAWPGCPQCGKPMELFLQFNLGQLPEGHPLRERGGLVQLFFCVADKQYVGCDTFQPPDHLLRFIVARDLDQLAPAEASPVHEPFPEKVIAGWRQEIDYPFDEEVLDGVSAAAYDAFYGRYPLEGNKSIGWPRWPQFEDYPSCALCGKEMTTSVFQIDSKHNVPYWFGDAGNCHVCMCEKHSEQIALTWACS